MKKPEFEEWSHQVGRPYIWAPVKIHTENTVQPWQSYDGTYTHPLAIVSIRGSDWPNNPYCFADFIYGGLRYHLKCQQYLTPRSFCRHVKNWLENTIVHN